LGTANQHTCNKNEHSSIHCANQTSEPLLYRRMLLLC
jgi:hypothetical protein